MKDRRNTCVEHIIKHKSFLANVLEGSVQARNCSGRPRANHKGQLIVELGCQTYVELKRVKQDPAIWKAA